MSRVSATVVHSLKRLALADEHVSDSLLLRTYVESRDEQAFLSLMRRHGPMVMGVCRRWLGSTPDAEDAFQNTFIALSQQAARIKENVPGWLHRVAQRTSRKALQQRRQFISADCDQWGKENLDRVEWRDLRRALDEELERLPSSERSALVLCLVEGLTRDEAAERLGVSLRTVDRCLQRGRAHLRARLNKRGLALLAATLLFTEGLIASVPTSLSKSTLQAAIKATPLPSAGFSVASWLGLTGVAATTLTVAIGWSGGVTSTSPAPPEKPVVPEQLLVMAPVLRDRLPPDPWGNKIAPSRDAAIAYLKSVQMKDGTWEDGSAITLSQPGGQTALVTLALLESGLKANDPVLERSLKYLRQLPPQHTYVISLCTQVFCLTGDREDKARIQNQVDWFIKAIQRSLGKFDGWGYTQQPSRGDFSNTQYAITALYAAHRAGIKIEEKILKEIHERLLETQLRNGGWPYTPQSTATHTMTCSTLFCLQMVDECLGEKETSREAMKKGLAWLDQNFAIENAIHTFYNLDVLSRLGKLAAIKSINERDWFQEGFDFITSKQDERGAIRIAGPTMDSNPKISTSLALRFYANRIR